MNSLGCSIAAPLHDDREEQQRQDDGQYETAGAKLANDIIDTPATMAVKSHLRNNLPVVIAPSTNNALSR